MYYILSGLKVKTGVVEYWHNTFIAIDGVPLRQIKSKPKASQLNLVLNEGSLIDMFWEFNVGNQSIFLGLQVMLLFKVECPFEKKKEVKT